MTLLQAIILGIIQGATEFIPISSSGHLVLAPHYLGWEINPEIFFGFSVLVQVSTLFAVIVYFRSDLLEIVIAFIAALKTNKWKDSPNAMLGVYLILATIPAGVAGLFLQNIVEEAFGNILGTSIFLILTGLILFIGDYLQTRSTTKTSLTWVDSIIIGFFQVLAIFPGISRSGATISGGLTRGLERREAARFSFLMSIPIMLAAGLLAVVDLIQSPITSSQMSIFIVGFIVSGITGYISIRWLLSFLATKTMKLFGIYCIALGTLTITAIYI